MNNADDQKIIDKYLGRQCREPITKIGGMCTAVLRGLNGNYRLAILPASTDGKIPDTMWTDYHFVEPGELVHAPIPFANNPDFVLGSYARDLVTGASGTLTDKGYYMNGCVRFGLTGRSNAEGKLSVDEYFDAQRIELMEGSPFSQKSRPARTGGPITTSSPNRSPRG